MFGAGRIQSHDIHENANVEKMIIQMWASYEGLSSYNIHLLAYVSMLVSARRFTQNWIEYDRY